MRICHAFDFSQIWLRDLYRVRALLARRRLFAVPYRTVQCTVYTFPNLFVLYVHSMLVILPRLNCTQVETRLLRRAPPTLRPWMKEVRDNTSRRGACLRCPVSTSVHFSLRNEGSSEYMCQREREVRKHIQSTRVSFQQGPTILSFKKKIKNQTLRWVQN